MFKNFSSYILLVVYILNLHTQVLSDIENKRLDNISKKYGSKQLIVVSVDSNKDFLGELDSYENVNGRWKKVFSDLKVMVGENGISPNKKEGDKKTPEGIYKLSQSFGTSVKPKDLKIKYIQTTKYDYWIDDVNSKDYNKYEHFYGNPQTRWKSYEKLNLSCYKYAIVVDYNMTPIVKGNGSAIFIHKFTGAKKGSNGCIQLSENDLLNILKWIDTSKGPALVVGTPQYINESFR
ncbi:MAG: L,D-transpeptidase family protein [Bacillota bacterium]|nr:L,D-transpeptidase family protein [Bacillota bacterium]